LVVGAGEIVGGVLSPTISGFIADQTSLAAHMVVMMVCALCGGVLSLFLRETAPGKAPLIDIDASSSLRSSLIQSSQP
jgi:fucose permease